MFSIALLGSILRGDAVNLVVAGLLGGLIPIVLKLFHVDPAVASSIFFTTATDIIGFFAFLGLATLLLL